MRKYLIILLGLIVAFISGWFFKGFIINLGSIAPDTQISEISNEKPLEKYAFDKLSQSDIKAGTLMIIDTIKETDDFNSYLFAYEFNPNLDGKTLKKTTGQINIPSGLRTSGSETQKTSVVIMFRGYINQELYRTGDGTRNASEYFARNGFITVAPDFLGYGGSDKESENIFETRFQTYVTAISLINTLEQIKINPQSVSVPDQVTNQLFNHSSIFLWGHSNGGQIALTTLEITGADYPTTLWAPVTKPFPYSILYYTDTSEDRGKFIRSELAKFESNYDVEKYSLTNYLDRINAPIQLHQGAIDDAVPQSWSDNLANQLRSFNKDVEYHLYPSTDHNMRPNWNIVIERDLEFFKKFLQ